MTHAAELKHLAVMLAQSRLVSSVLQRWSDVDLPNAWLAAGAVAQTVWNIAHSRAAEADIRDVDLVYFDDSDLSGETEHQHEARIRRAFADLVVSFDVKNEARVHIWYEGKFGQTIPPYRSVEEAIATFPTTATAVGVRPIADGLEICAPFGLADLLGLVVRPNKAQITRTIYETKIARWRPCWPKLEIVPWHTAPAD